MQILLNMELDSNDENFLNYTAVQAFLLINCCRAYFLAITSEKILTCRYLQKSQEGKLILILSS